MERTRLQYMVSAVGISIFLGACGAPRINMLYDSEPSGASVYQGGVYHGRTPHRISIEQTEAFKNGGCMRVAAARVLWASGAKAATGPRSVCKAHGNTFHHQFARPNVPGRDIDVDVSIQSERLALERERVRIAQDRLDHEREQARLAERRHHRRRREAARRQKDESSTVIKEPLGVGSVEKAKRDSKRLFDHIKKN